MNEKLFYSLIFLAGPLSYLYTNAIKPRFYWESLFDRKIKPIALFIIPYIGFFPFLVMAFLTVLPTGNFKQYAIASGIAVLISRLFWFFVPNGVKRPDQSFNNILGKTLQQVWIRDKNDNNGCPSMHVFDSLIGGFFLAAVFPVWQSPILAISLLIAISTIFTKQHYLVDFFGGLILAIFSIYLSEILIRII